MNSTPNSTPTVELFVPAYNARRTLAECVTALLAQQAPCSLRVVVVDDGSTDDTAAVARNLDGCELLQLEQNSGIAAARNAALREASADYVGFVDSDIHVEPGWLAALLAVLQNDQADIACGEIHPAAAERDVFHYYDDQTCEDVFGELTGPIPRPAYQIMPFNYLFRREVFAQVGPFDERFRTNAEDSDYFHRCALAGLRFWLAREARGTHDYGPVDTHAYARKARRVGRQVLYFHLKWRTRYLPAKLALALGCGLLCWLYYVVTLLLGIDAAASNKRLRNGKAPSMLWWEYRVATRYFKALGEAQTFCRALVTPSLWDRKPQCKTPLPFSSA